MGLKFSDLLNLITGICWSIAYIDLIHRGFSDKTYGMPLFGLAFNIPWEFGFGFLWGHDATISSTIKMYVSRVWFILDVVIAVTYFRYGSKEFPHIPRRLFLPWSLAPFLVAVTVWYAMADMFGVDRGIGFVGVMLYTLMLAILFNSMLVSRNDVRGQSMYVAGFMLLGDLSAMIKAYLAAPGGFTLILATDILIFNLIYVGMLYTTFHRLGLNPFTRKPIS